MSTPDLAAWLLEQVAADERVARSAPEVEPKSAADIFTSLHAPTGTVEMSIARVLADCEAKRQIVERQTCDDAPDCGDHDCAIIDEDRRILAQPYADRPGFDESWRL